MVVDWFLCGVISAVCSLPASSVVEWPVSFTEMSVISLSLASDKDSLMFKMLSATSRYKDTMKYSLN